MTTEHDETYHLWPEVAGQSEKDLRALGLCCDEYPNLVRQKKADAEEEVKKQLEADKAREKENEVSTDANAGDSKANNSKVKQAAPDATPEVNRDGGQILVPDDGELRSAFGHILPHSFSPSLPPATAAAQPELIDAAHPRQV